MFALISARAVAGTSVALETACEIARSGGRSIVVDVDATAPTIHAATGVAREPTLAALDRGRSLGATIHSHPRTAGVAIVPAPLPDQHVDIAGALARLRDVEPVVLVDAPLGAGPAVAQTLEAVTGAVVLTSDGDQITERDGAVGLAHAFDVSIVERITVHDDAIDEAAGRLAEMLGPTSTGWSPDSRPTPEVVGDGSGIPAKAKSYETTTVISRPRMVGRLETGIDVLDRKLDGGLPPGSTVAFTASPASQSELLLYELTAARGTLYLATERSDEVVRHSLESSGARVGSPTVRQVDDENPLEEARRLVGALPDGANLIVDTMDVIEQSDEVDYRQFLNELKTQMLETGSIAVLHCLKTDATPANRATTLHIADAVFNLETTIGAAELENFLTIPKFRAGGAPTERIKLELAERVTIDTSRDIA